MKKLDIEVSGETMEAMAEALEYAAQQLRLGTVSEYISWENPTADLVFDVIEVKEKPNE